MIHIVLVMEIVAIIIAVMVVIVIYYNSKCGEEPGTSLGVFSTSEGVYRGQES